MKLALLPLKDYLGLISDVFELTNLKVILIKVSLLILAFFTPIYDIICGMLFLVICDLVTGVVAASKRKEKITSSKLSRTISEILIYLATIVITHVINDHMLFGPDVVPLESLVTSYIALTELKSILENFDKMTKGKMSALGAIMRALSNERFQRKTHTKRIKDKKKN